MLWVLVLLPVSSVRGEGEVGSAHLWPGILGLERDLLPNSEYDHCRFRFPSCSDRGRLCAILEALPDSRATALAAPCRA